MCIYFNDIYIGLFLSLRGTTYEMYFKRNILCLEDHSTLLHYLMNYIRMKSSCNMDAHNLKIIIYGQLNTVIRILFTIYTLLHSTHLSYFTYLTLLYPTLLYLTLLHLLYFTYFIWLYLLYLLLTYLYLFYLFIYG